MKTESQSSSILLSLQEEKVKLGQSARSLVYMMVMVDISVQNFLEIISITLL
jgi:hypothetical protein